MDFTIFLYGFDKVVQCISLTNKTKLKLIDWFNPIETMRGTLCPPVTYLCINTCQKYQNFITHKLGQAPLDHQKISKVKHYSEGSMHSSYVSQPPQPTVVYFFLASVLFSIENTCWPSLANFDQFWLFCREFTEFFGVLFIDLNNAAVY